jgi:acetylornithine deacetylase
MATAEPGATPCPAGLPDELALLWSLVATPSVSGSEAAVAQQIVAWAESQGLSPVCDDTSLRIALDGKSAGPTLALVSHLDVVPPGAGWTREPFVPSLESGRLYGRGACDAKASVAAMLCALRDLKDLGGPACGRLLIVLGYCEETRDTSMPRAVPVCGPLDAAIIGEPTSLDLAVAQRGLMVAELRASGDQRHAAYVSESSYRSAVLSLASDLVKLPGLLQDRPHPILGQPSIAPTMLEAGVARNVTPPSAKALLDLRTTPAWTHAEVGAALRAALSSELHIVSERLVPCETPPSSRLLTTMQAVRPAARAYGSPTCSDWVFLRHLDAVKCGPGESLRSHTPDEWVDSEQVTAARHFYREVAQRYLAGTP